MMSLTQYAPLLQRLQKFWRDHVYYKSYDLELRLKIAEAPYRHKASDHGLDFFIISDADDPQLSRLVRDFPRQSRTFPQYIARGCIMLVLGDDTRTMGYFFAATKDFYDAAQYRLTFRADQRCVYAYNFYVDPTYRTKPIARVLLSEGLRQLHALGHQEVTAMCDSSEKALVRLYRQFNLRATGQGVTFYRVLHQRFSRRDRRREISVSA